MKNHSIATFHADFIPQIGHFKDKNMQKFQHLYNRNKIIFCLDKKIAQTYSANNQYITLNCIIIEFFYKIGIAIQSAIN